MGKRNKEINYMEVPVKKKKKSQDIRAYTVHETAKGRLTANEDTHSRHNSRQAKADEVAPTNDLLQSTDLHQIDSADTSLFDSPENVPSQRELYITKNKGRSSIHVKLAHWLPYRQTYLDELLAHEGCSVRPGLLVCPRCDEMVDIVELFRCIDCYSYSLYCQSCMVALHHELILHRVQRWNGKFFEKAPLSGLGLRTQLGHNGGLCSKPAAGSNNFLVMDTSGFHFVNVDFCDCGLGPPRYVQLLRARLFPTTTDRPQTAYTFDVLDCFEELSLQGKTNVYDFYNAIIYRTSKSEPPAVHRYKDFAFAVRLWRHLLMLKRAGRGHDPAGVSATQRGELAVECPACPHPSRNLPADWKTALDDRRWLYTQFLAVDANFKLKLKDRGLRDVELAPGWAYFVEEEEYQKTVASFADEVETNSCRSQHNAILAANLRNVQEYKASGTGAVVCGRHLLMCKSGVGDLQRGERYANMDYIVLSTLENSETRDILISYDIGCQWSRNLVKRIPRYPEHLQFDMSNVRLRTVVPKFHLPAHGPQCQTRFSLNFIPKVGRTYGEGVESEWAHINGTATSTREMAPAVRHEALNDHWGAWNWKKILGFGNYFSKKLDEAIGWHAEHQSTLTSMSANVPAETIQKWDAMICAWNDDQDAEDPYAEPLLETTVNDVRKEFADEDAEEARSETTSTHAVTARAFLSIGLELEERQRAFRMSPKIRNTRTSLLAANVQNMRTNLYRQIVQWRQAQDIYMPGIAVHRQQVVVSSKEASEDTLSGSSVVGVASDGGVQVHAELIPLLLPSSLPHLASPVLHELEVRLRKAQADDALATIRRLRRTMSGLSAFKRLNVNGTGNKSNTRMQTLYSKFQAKIKLAVQRYRVSRSALISLQPDMCWATQLNELKDDDIRGPDRNEDDKKQKKIGEGRYQPSWIWLVPGANVNEDGTSIDFGDSVRVEWAKTKARVMRWREEIELLCEEMRRVLAFFDWKARWWSEQCALRSNLPQPISSGISAYASKQGELYTALALMFSQQWIPRLQMLEHVPTWITSEHRQAARRRSHSSTASPTKASGNHIPSEQRDQSQALWSDSLGEDDENDAEDDLGYDEGDIDVELHSDSALEQNNVFDEDDMLTFREEDILHPHFHDTSS